MIECEEGKFVFSPAQLWSMCKKRVGPQVYIYSPQKITFIILYPSLPLYYHFPLRLMGRASRKGLRLMVRFLTFRVKYIQKEAVTGL